MIYKLEILPFHGHLCDYFWYLKEVFLCGFYVKTLVVGPRLLDTVGRYLSTILGGEVDWVSSVGTSSSSDKPLKMEPRYRDFSEQGPLYYPRSECVLGCRLGVTVWRVNNGIRPFGDRFVGVGSTPVTLFKFSGRLHQKLWGGGRKSRSDK